MKGASDSEVIQRAREEQLPVLSFDSDFFKYGDHPGIFHITSRASYDSVTEAVADIVSRIEKPESENSVIRINPANY